jgi:hypothetical protein
LGIRGMERKQLEELFLLLKEKGYDTKEIFNLIEHIKKTPVII